MRKLTRNWRDALSRGIHSFEVSRLTRSRQFLAVLILLALALGVFLIGIYPRQAANSLSGAEVTDVDRRQVENDYRSTGAQILLGIGLLIGVWLTHRRVRAVEKQAESAARQVEVAEQGQITERFTRAIEQLGKSGDENLAIRLGGIYALERIMRDSERDHETVRSVLVTVIRNATAAPIPPYLNEEEFGSRAKLPSDVQAALTVVGRNPPRDPDQAEALDLTGAHLAGADLKGLSLTHSKFQSASFDNANLEGTDFEGCDLSKANLRNTRAYAANFTKANLCAADMTSAHP